VLEPCTADVAFMQGLCLGAAAAVVAAVAVVDPLHAGMPLRHNKGVRGQARNYELDTVLGTLVVSLAACICLGVLFATVHDALAMH
jgi:hypothetical protein